ncbi:MAG: prolyl oligopeptidase family serine peptidase [Gammaproteobacteria bacterium]|nr:prolyl oligopeptidase family serine peptidase [Gammaproteobacteria bacterium]
MKIRPKPLLPLIFAGSLLTAACGGGGGGSASPPPPQMPSGRGQLIQSPPSKAGSLSATELLAGLSSSQQGQVLLQFALAPTCSVDTYHVEYMTVGARGEPATASAALMIPTGSDPVCQGPHPVVLYAHGKRVDKLFNIADVTNPKWETLALAAVSSARGYIVVASNYAGYDVSDLAYHPYLDADQQSGDMMDALSAAHTALTALNVADNHKLFVTGYSQGGYVAMATHRALQAAGVAVTASAPMSGPYALSAFGDAVFMGQVDDGATEDFVMVATSYQHAYGNLYSDPTEVFEPAYASGIDSLLPSTSDVNTLITQGRLPQSTLFSSTPPDPEFAPITPATAPAPLAAVFAAGFGPGNLVTNAYRLGYLRDAQAEPDGGFPKRTTGVPPPNPANTLRQDLKANDLRNWSPTAPMLLCAGNSDPSVFYLNTRLMQDFWTMNAPDSEVTVLDVDSPVGNGDAYANVKLAFAEAKSSVAAAAVAAGVTDGGAAAVLQVYHADLVPPFCLVAAASFFNMY